MKIYFLIISLAVFVIVGVLNGFTPIICYIERRYQVRAGIGHQLLNDGLNIGTGLLIILLIVQYVV